APSKVAPAPQAPSKVAPAPQAPAPAPAPQAPAKVAPAPQAPAKIAPAPQAPMQAAPAPQAPAKVAPAPQAPAPIAPAPPATASELRRPSPFSCALPARSDSSTPRGTTRPRRELAQHLLDGHLDRARDRDQAVSPGEPLVIQDAPAAHEHGEPAHRRQLLK